MALLNFTSSYSNISTYLSATSGTANWLKIFISPDATGGGHFITHGIDFGASYNAGARGLVPVNTASDLTKTFFRGDGWSALWTSAAETAAAVGDTDAQKLAAKEAYLQSTLVSAYNIKQWILQAFTANDSMRFVGTINIDGSGNITTTTEAGTTNGFPTACEVGQTYKINGATVGTSSQIAGEVVSSGDMAICIKAGTGASLNDAQYWAIVQDNVEHLITYTINGTAHSLYAQTSGNITLYAPSTSGTATQVLISSGVNAAPVWVDQNTLVVAEAAKVTNALTKGNGILMSNQGTAETSYDGSKAILIALAPATTSVIGGVIIDDGTKSVLYNSGTPNTKYPTVSVDTNGVIYLTHTNITNALGYDPDRVFTDTYNGLVPMASTANKQTNSTDNVAANTTYLLGADAKWYKLPVTSFSSTWRGIKLEGTDILDTSDGSNGGLALNFKASGHTTITANKTNNVYDGSFTFASTWRDIQVHLISGGTISQSAGSIQDNDPLVFDNSESIFMLGEEITVGSGANATTKTVIKSYITWYNMDTSEYEIV